MVRSVLETGDPITSPIGKETQPLNELAHLRRRALERLGQQPPRWSSELDVTRLIEELQIYQAELEIQNEDLRQTQLQLEESRQEYIELYDFAPVGYFTLDDQGYVLAANLTGVTLLKTNRSTLIGQPFLQFLQPDQQGLFYQHRRQVIDLDAKQSCELVMLKADQTPFIARLETTPAPGEAGRLQTAVIDITEQKQLEEAYRKLVDESLQGLAILQDERIVFANPTFARISGYSLEQLRAFSADEVKSLLHPGDQLSVRRSLAACQAGRDIDPHLEFRIICQDGSTRWVEAYISRIEYRRQLSLKLVCVEITARKQAEAENESLLEALKQQNDQLRILSARLADIQEEERQSLARELHDRVGQYLTALGFNINFVQSQLQALPEPPPSPLQTRLDQAATLVEQTTDCVRDIMAELRPPLLDEYGLPDALAKFANDFAAWTELEAIIRCEPVTPRPPASVENTLFRIAQEALNNVAKHARASQVTVTVEADAQLVRLTISDNGIGFSPELSSNAKERHSWGLLTMRERAEMIGGLCHIASQPGQGTTVTVEAPR